LIASPGASATCRISFAPWRRAALSLKATEQPIDTSTAAGKCFLGPTDIAKALKIGRASVYRVLGQKAAN
jgi:hypothetical protein